MIVPIIKKGTSCDFHRLYLPLKYMGVDVDSDKKLPTLLAEASVVVFNRWAGFEIEHLLRFKKKYGFKIICDLDDYFELYSRHILYKSWQEHDMKRKVLEGIFNADIVTVTTARLADVVKKYNKNVEVVPNGLPFDKEQFVAGERDFDKCQLLYVGGTSHFWDLLTLKSLFYKIAREDIKKKLQVSLAGYNDSNEESKRFWNAMESICTANKRLDYERKYNRPIEDYMGLYDGAGIAIAPLEDNYFNRFKSNLKILEAGCRRIPIVVSDIPPYSDEQSDLIMKCSSTSDWYKSIETLVKNPSLREEAGDHLGIYVRANYDLEKINEKRKQIFDYLCQK